MVTVIVNAHEHLVMFKDLRHRQTTVFIVVHTFDDVLALVFGLEVVITHDPGADLLIVQLAILIDVQIVEVSLFLSQLFWSQWVFWIIVVELLPGDESVLVLVSFLQDTVNLVGQQQWVLERGHERLELGAVQIGVSVLIRQREARLVVVVIQHGLIRSVTTIEERIDPIAVLVPADPIVAVLIVLREVFGHVHLVNLFECISNPGGQFSMGDVSISVSVDLDHQISQTLFTQLIGQVVEVSIVGAENRLSVSEMVVVVVMIMLVMMVVARMAVTVMLVVTAASRARMVAGVTLDDDDGDARKAYDQYGGDRENSVVTHWCSNDVAAAEVDQRSAQSTDSLTMQGSQ